MEEFNTEAVRIETASALETVRLAQADRQYPAYIGLDVHKETIAVAVAQAGRAAPESRGEIANKPKAVAKLVERLNRAFGGEVLLFCYEAGPCGYGLYRQLLALGHDCQAALQRQVQCVPPVYKPVKGDGGTITQPWVRLCCRSHNPVPLCADYIYNPTQSRRYFLRSPPRVAAASRIRQAIALHWVSACMAAAVFINPMKATTCSITAMHGLTGHCKPQDVPSNQHQSSR
jgi:hypothetical protein